MRAIKGILAFGLVVSSVTALAAQDRPRIIAVNQVLADFAEHLLDDEAEVVFPVPEGVDPSFWRPSIADISTVQTSDLILLNGAGFAAWVDRVSLPRSRLVDTSAGIKDRFIVTESITHSHGDGGEHSHEGLASYTWLDPTLAIAQAEAIAAAVIARDLGNASDIETRLSALRSELAELDTSARDALKDARGIAMIATHPRYQYFARHYDLSITSLEWEAGAMPTEDQLSELAGLTADLDASILIWEAQPPREAFEAAKALGLKSVIFDPLAGKSSSGSYVDAYRDAVTNLSDAATSGSD